MNGDNLHATAFINVDNTVAVVVLNTSDEACDYKVWIDSKSVHGHSAAHSIATVVAGE